MDPRVREKLDQVWRQISEEYRGQKLERIEKFVAMATERAPRTLADPRQQPEFFYFPDLRAKPWHDPGEFPWVAKLERSAPQIREELKSLLEKNPTFEPYISGQNLKYRQDKFKLPAGSQSWSTFKLRDGTGWLAENCAAVPKTAQVVRTSFRDDLGDPFECFFSILKPGTHLPGHYGFNNYQLTFHLGLVVPEGCTMRVDQEIRTWQEGRCLIFDDTYEHEVWHRGTEIRVVLLGGIWHPDLSELEIKLIRRIRESISSLLPQDVYEKQAAIRGPTGS